RPRAAASTISERRGGAVQCLDADPLRVARTIILPPPVEILGWQMISRRSEPGQATRSASDSGSLLVVDGVLHDLARDGGAVHQRLDQRARLLQIPADLREAERLALEVRGLDRLRDEAD